MAPPKAHMLRLSGLSARGPLTEVSQHGISCTGTGTVATTKSTALLQHDVLTAMTEPSDTLRQICFSSLPASFLSSVLPSLTMADYHSD